MNLKKTLIYIILFAGFLQNNHSQDIADNDEIRSEFKSPPQGSWPKVYYWWLNGNIDTVRIVEEVEAMYQAGISGFDIFEIGAGRSDQLMPVGKVVFMEDHFLRAVKIACDQAAKYGMKVGINMASSWNAGGKWITPEYAAKSMYYSKSTWEGKGMKLPFPKIVKTSVEGKIKLAEDEQIPEISYDKNGRPVFYREIAVLAIPLDKDDLNPEDIVDVSEFFDEQTEKLNWDQNGKYEIVRFIYSNSGEKLKLPSKNSEGPIIDHFDSRATTFHFNYIIDRLKKILDDDLGSTSLNSLYLASYEVVGNVWTESLPSTFKSLNGYEIYRNLPILLNKEIFPEATVNQFKRDFQYTLSELMINNFYKKAKEIANANGLLINSESGGPGFPLHNVPVEPLKSLGVMDLPRGEFWMNHSRLNDDGIDILRMVKEVSSASHIYGRKVVEEEAFTSFQHWQEGPVDMKPMGDRAFCEGMNRVVVHGWSHNPGWIDKPGIVYGAGTHYNDRRVWWPMVKPFNEYLSRVSNVLGKTDFFADVLYYYGDAVPNYTGHKNSRFMVGPGYDYEVINSEILLKLETKNGKLFLPTGAEFKLLVLEDEGKIRPEVLLKIKALAEKAATILSEKPNGVYQPRNTPNPENPQKMINDLWFDANSPQALKGKGVVSGISPLDMLGRMGIQPDFTYADAHFFTLDYIHNKKGDHDYYFIRNTTDQWLTRDCKFRQPNKSPEIWDPETGKIISPGIYNEDDNYVGLPLSLPPYGSTFVVFSPISNTRSYTGITNSAGVIPRLIYDEDGIILPDEGVVRLTTEQGSESITNYVKEIPIDGAWEVYFSDQQVPATRYIYPELVSWIASENEAIKYYSGIATYKKTFQFDINSVSLSDTKIHLTLGDLSKIARVYLNGKLVGICWTKPFSIDVTDFLIPGDNLLEVEVANTWSNRITGDAITNGDLAFTNITSTNIDGLNKTRVPWDEVPLIRSGLMGPVKLVVYKPIK